MFHPLYLLLTTTNGKTYYMLQSAYRVSGTSMNYPYISSPEDVNTSLPFSRIIADNPGGRVAIAVILVEVYGDVVDEIVIDRADLPADAAHLDAVLDITLTSDGEATAIEYDTAASTDRKEQAQSRFDRLAERPPEDDDSP